MNGFCKAILLGNVTRDPELRYTPNGTAVCSLGIACNRVWYNDEGNQQEDVTFVDITFFGGRGEAIAKYVSKGRPLFVEGRLQLDQWQDRQTGAPRSKLKVVGENFIFLGSGERDEAEERPAPRPTASTREAEPGTDPPPVEDDDVPF